MKKLTDLGERKRDVNFAVLLTNAFIDSSMCPDQGLNPQPWCIGTTLQASDPAGMYHLYFLSHACILLFKMCYNNRLKTSRCQKVSKQVLYTEKQERTSLDMWSQPNQHGFESLILQLTSHIILDKFLSLLLYVVTKFLGGHMAAKYKKYIFQTRL